MEISHEGFTEEYLLEKAFYESGDSYRIFTAIFLHPDFPSLANNIVFLILYGSIMEKYIGSFRTGLVFFATAISGNLVGLYGSRVLRDPFMGADGGIYGILGVTLGYLLLNWQRVPLPHSNKLGIYWINIAVICFSFLYTSTYKLIYCQAGGCLSGIFLGLFICPIIGSKSKFKIESQNSYENTLMIIGVISFVAILLTGIFINRDI